MEWNLRRTHFLGLTMVVTLVLAASAVRVTGQAAASGKPAPVTFTKHIAPILQQKCQSCHRPTAGAPMSLITYEEARPWARSMKHRTGLGSKPDAMPPWYIDKSIGIQSFKEDMSLTAEEVAQIAAWADNAAPQGNPADMPPPRRFAAAKEWQLGQPDLVVPSPSFEMPALAPDRFTPIGMSPSGLTEDRYVASVEVREITDAMEETPGGATRQTVGGQVIFHHLAWMPMAKNMAPDVAGNWPVHEVGRNPDIFDPQAGKLLPAGVTLNFISAHVHSNGKRTKAHVEVGFRFHPKGYKPTKKFVEVLATSRDFDIRPMEADNRMEAFAVLQDNMRLVSFEPHMHAYGARMCLDAMWSNTTETLVCSGYNHSWVRSYAYTEGAQPLLPKGTILRMRAVFDNSPSNRNVPDPRNWSGSGHRSIDNMAVAITQAIPLSEEEFQQAVAKRRDELTEGRTQIGCPTCGVGKKTPVVVAGR